MSTTLSPADADAFRARCREFLAEQHARGPVRDIEDHRAFTIAAAEAGLGVAILYPTEYGGAGMDAIAYTLAMFEIAQADCAHSTIMSVNNTRSCGRFGPASEGNTWLMSRCRVALYSASSSVRHKPCAFA